MDRRPALVALVLLALFLAGCDTPPCDRPNLTSRAVAAEAPHEDGLGEGLAVIQVVGQPGEIPLAGARVMTYWAIRPETTLPGDLQAAVDEAIADGGVTGSGSTLVGTPLTADGAGRARLHLPLGVRFGFAASHPGYGEEAVLSTYGPNGTEPLILTIPLYRSNLEVQVNGTFTGADVTGEWLGGVPSGGDVEWEESEIPWTAEDEVSREYTRRLVGFEALLEWKNAAGEQADLGLGVGLPDEGMLVYRNAQDDFLEMGSRSESVVLNLDDLGDMDMVADGSILAGPTYEALAAPIGLDYTITLRGTFDPEELRGRYCTLEYDDPRIVMMDDVQRHYDGAAPPVAYEEGDEAAEGDASGGLDAAPADSLEGDGAWPETQPLDSTAGTDARVGFSFGSLALILLVAVPLLAAVVVAASKRR